MTHEPLLIVAHNWGQALPVILPPSVALLQAVYIGPEWPEYGWAAPAHVKALPPRKPMAYPEWVCQDCCEAAPWALRMPHFSHGDHWTLWDGSQGVGAQVCDVCGRQVPVAEPGDQGYPYFEGWAEPEWAWIDEGWVDEL